MPLEVLGIRCQLNPGGDQEGTGAQKDRSEKRARDGFLLGRGAVSDCSEPIPQPKEANF
jgi:hypothetical protein